MNINQLSKKLEHQRRKLLIYEEQQWAKKMGDKALNFVNNNFETESYNDNVKIPWKRLKKSHPGKKLQSSSHHLRDSVKVQYLDKSFKLYSRLKYASVHNDGYKGIQHVRGYQRRKKLSGNIFGENGKAFPFGANSSIKSHRRLKNKPVFDTVDVKSFTRKMNIPRRQFMPDAKRGSHTLIKEIKEQTEKDIKKILKTIK